VPLRRELKDIFLHPHRQGVGELGLDVNVPIINVNTPQTLADDPQFQDRFPWIPAERLGCDQLPIARSSSSTSRSRVPTKAPTVGQHTDEVLREVLGYDDARIAALREAGTLG
jgi:crotonobetainyl-CoA:carnitine CoA-transferase CaiB-like acyl-CoA transferase